VGGTATGGKDYLQSIVTLAPSLNQSSTPAIATSLGGVVVTGGTGACVNGASYWDIGVRGDTGPTDHSSGFTLTPQYSVLTNLTGYTGHNNLAPSALGLVSQYCNGSRVPPEYASGGYQVPPGTNEGTVPVPVFSLLPGATVDEGNNWVNMKWGPLAMTSPMAPNGVSLANYAPAAGSTAIDVIPVGQSHPSTDFFGNARPSPSNPSRFDVGAVEFQGAGASTAILAVSPTSLSFTNVVRGTTSAAQTLTLSNTGGTGATGIAVAVTAPFSRPTGTGGGTCGATLAAGANCTINIVYSPGTGVTSSSGTATITANVTVTGSPVTLTGTAVAQVISAIWSPASRNYGNQTRNCPGGTPAQILACTLDPTQVFTLTNNGNVTLNVPSQATLTGTNASEFSIARLLSTCGPAGGGQLSGQTSLAPGATCTVTVQFKPLTAQTTGLKSATLSISDAAGTQTAGLSGTAQ